MRAVLPSFLAGLLFGLGLTVSHMINPAKIVGFLDFAGDWDPTLALVMIGALTVTVPAFALAGRLKRPLLAKAFRLPDRLDIDTSLLAGAVLFGIGWGLAGFCPGPALAALATGLWQVGLFVAAMLAGMFLHARLTAD